MGIGSGMHGVKRTQHLLLEYLQDQQYYFTRWRIKLEMGRKTASKIKEGNKDIVFRLFQISKLPLAKKHFRNFQKRG